MKKTLIALAALASTAAFAQSSVTVSGIVDANVNRAIGATTTSLGQATASRLQFIGTEDLGGGLKAHFALDHRFNTDTGAQSNPNSFWGGYSTVGLSGAFGKVDLGRTYSAAFWTALAGDVFGYDGVAANSATAGAGTQAVRFANGIFYTSPNFGGFTARFSYSLKEDVGANNGTSLELKYANGPVSASVAAEKNINGNKYTGVGAAYDFGAAKANLLVTKGETAAGVDSDGVLVGVVVPLGALTLKASYATLEVGDVKTVSQVGLGARYAFSKRTDLYASFANNSKRDTDKNGWELGITHRF